MAYEVSISDLNKRLTIEEFTTVTTDNGFEEQNWVEFKTIWARKKALSGRDFWSAKAINAEDTILFTIRYNKALEVLFSKNARLKYRLKLKDIVYKIEFTNNVQESNEWIEIKAVETDE